MTESVTTKIDTTIHVSDATRAAAVRVLTRTGNADLLVVLGLDAGARPVLGPGDCDTCGNRLPGHGVCRRTRQCRDGAGGAECRPKCGHCRRPLPLSGRCRKLACLASRKRVGS